MKFLLTNFFCILIFFLHSQNSISLHRYNGKTEVISQNLIDSISFSNFDQNGWINFNEFSNYGALIDQNGNVYKTIVIGSQEWMAENLRSMTFTNGDSIPNLELWQNWSAASGPAWSYYLNDSIYNNRNGKLYNGYTVVDQRNVCPSGWHVPSIQEWGILMHYVSPNGALFSWDELTTMGSIGQYKEFSNESGFSAFPTGYRDYNGAWGVSIDEFNYWTSTFTITPNLIRFISMNTLTNSDLPNAGMSVRCVKN
jgi:uncharacterized protein (TIGR02145 family)